MASIGSGGTARSRQHENPSLPNRRSRKPKEIGGRNRALTHAVAQSTAVSVVHRHLMGRLLQRPQQSRARRPTSGRPRFPCPRQSELWSRQRAEATRPHGHTVKPLHRRAVRRLTEHLQALRFEHLGALNWTRVWFKANKSSPRDIGRQFVRTLRYGLERNRKQSRRTVGRSQ